MISSFKLLAFKSKHSCTPYNICKLLSIKFKFYKKYGFKLELKKHKPNIIITP